MYNENLIVFSSPPSLLTQRKVRIPDISLNWSQFEVLIDDCYEILYSINFILINLFYIIFFIDRLFF